MWRATVACLALLTLEASALSSETVGQRPYEMDWAGRTEDTRPPLVDFENLDGWRVETVASVAEVQLSRQQQLWGKHVARLTYRGTGERAPVVTLKPARPVPFAGPVDCVNLWAYGNNWAWQPDKSTPSVTITAVLQSPRGEVVRVNLGNVNWREWWLMHRKLTPEQAALVREGGTLAAIEVSGGRNRDNRELYFDNLAVYQEPLNALSFAPRPQRGIDMFAGQGSGTNTGPGRLPFPTRDETILPDNLAKHFTTTLTEQSGEFVFRYAGDDGVLVYRYRPATGDLSDISVQWNDEASLRPMVGGGVRLVRGSAEPSAPERIEPSKVERVGDTVRATWHLVSGDTKATAQYTFRLWQKSLVIDVQCEGGAVGEVRFGRAVGAVEPRLVTLPYLACEAARPAVLVMRGQKHPWFLMGLVDHCRSNASALFAENRIGATGVTYNAGSRYLPKTDGRRNDCFERLFLTASPRFEEVLPNVPNPKSPWMQVTGERVWRAHGASNRENDYKLWKGIARRGMSKILVTDHETGWRDGGESFTFRTRAAPGRGGDESQRDYSRKMHELGFRYGIYNNYTDYAPVNEHWREDRVTRTSNGDWVRAWARCYNPKPAWAVEAEAALTPVIQRKFGLDTAYCDVHTAVQPWRYCDFDARVPGAGTFAATFYAYGEIMLHQKQVWNGPVYSEGNNHWYYCGLTDGNYGQDQVARLAENPWLVDFDLRKLHPLCCNFGMGNPEMFFGRNAGFAKHPSEQEAMLDRFLAASLAFGHTGFLVTEGGLSNAARSYFMVQQVHARYAGQAAKQIRYADEQGRLLDTSAAVAEGAYTRSQLAVTYDDGLQLLVNGHTQASWNVEGYTLPPNGWAVRDPAGKIVSFSATVDDHRADYIDSPAYLYADGRGHLTRFPKATCDGAMIVVKNADHVELIPMPGCQVFGVSLDGRAAKAEALDEERRSLGAVETRVSRGLVYVVPGKTAAFSYRLTPLAAAPAGPGISRDRIIPGETISLASGSRTTSLTAERAAAPGSQLWRQVEGTWIDFLVVPLARATLQLKDVGLQLTLVPNVAQAAEAEVRLGPTLRRVRLEPGRPALLEFPRPAVREGVEPIKLHVEVDGLTFERTWYFKQELEMPQLAVVPELFAPGQARRGRVEEDLGGSSGAQVAKRESVCGGESRASVFMHPPYQGGVGYSFALFDAVTLPKSPAATFRVDVGKVDGSDRGDGIRFQVAVVEADGKTTMVAEKLWAEHGWTGLEAALSSWAGKSIQLKLIADVGARDNSSGDWAAWSNLRIQSAEPQLVGTLHDAPIELQHAPGPYASVRLKAADLRDVRSGTLHYEAIGLQSAGQYISQVTLNRQALGNLPGAAGNEERGTWAKASLPITPAALATLGSVNQLAIINPGGDSFKIRRFWIELRLTDDRTISSRIATTVFTQPADWRYAEGVRVPRDKNIETEIRFDLAR